MCIGDVGVFTFGYPSPSIPLTRPIVPHRTSHQVLQGLARMAMHVSSIDHISAWNWNSLRFVGDVSFLLDADMVISSRELSAPEHRDYRSVNVGIELVTVVVLRLWPGVVRSAYHSLSAESGAQATGHIGPHASRLVQMSDNCIHQISWLIKNIWNM